MRQCEVRPLDRDEQSADQAWSIDPYYSGPNAGDNPNRHEGMTKWDQITTPAERATMDPRTDVEVIQG